MSDDEAQVWGGEDVCAVDGATSLQGCVDDERRRLNSTDFILFSALFAVCIAWRTPLVAFLLVGASSWTVVLALLAAIALVVLPALHLELSIGHIFRQGLTGAIGRVAPLFRCVGWTFAGICALLALGSSVQASRALYYCASAISITDWTSCGHAWNTDGMFTVTPTTTSIICQKFNQEIGCDDTLTAYNKWFEKLNFTIGRQYWNSAVSDWVRVRRPIFGLLNLAASEYFSYHLMNRDASDDDLVAKAINKTYYDFYHLPYVPHHVHTEKKSAAHNLLCLAAVWALVGCALIQCDRRPRAVLVALFALPCALLVALVLCLCTAGRVPLFDGLFADWTHDEDRFSFVALADPTAENMQTAFSLAFEAFGLLLGVFAQLAGKHDTDCARAKSSVYPLAVLLVPPLASTLFQLVVALLNFGLTHHLMTTLNAKTAPLYNAPYATRYFEFALFPTVISILPEHLVEFFAFLYYVICFLFAIAYTMVFLQTATESLLEQFGALRKWRYRVYAVSCIFMFMLSVETGLATPNGEFTAELMETYALALRATAALVLIHVILYAYGWYNITCDLSAVFHQYLALPTSRIWHRLSYENLQKYMVFIWLFLLPGWSMVSMIHFLFRSRYQDFVVANRHLRYNLHDIISTVVPLLVLPLFCAAEMVYWRCAAGKPFTFLLYPMRALEPAADADADGERRRFDAPLAAVDERCCSRACRRTTAVRVVVGLETLLLGAFVAFVLFVAISFSSRPPWYIIAFFVELVAAVCAAVVLAYRAVSLASYRLLHPILIAHSTLLALVVASAHATFAQERFRFRAFMLVPFLIVFVILVLGVAAFLLIQGLHSQFRSPDDSASDDTTIGDVMITPPIAGENPT